MGTKERLEILVGTQSKGKTQELINDLLTRISNLEFEVERLNNIIEEIREYVKHKIVECYDEGSTIGEFYKICDIDSKLKNY